MEMPLPFPNFLKRLFYAIKNAGVLPASQQICSLSNFTTMQKHIFLFAMTAVLVLTVGCGKNPTLSGKVYYVDDNSPVTQGTVIFLNNNYTGRAQIDKNGSYSVQSESEGYGLPPGTYKVYLDGTEKVSVEGGGVKMEKLVGIKYTNPDTSGLTITHDKARTYDIPVERFSAAAR